MATDTIYILKNYTTMFKTISLLCSLSVCTLSYLCATSSMAIAQVTSDGTVNTQVTTDGNVDEITGGETRGDNLFHSFQDFSVPTNLVVPEETTEQACQSNREAEAKNGLNIVGKGGVPPAPELPLNSLNTISNGKMNPVSTIPAPIETSKGKIQPARGIEVTPSGTIKLTAYSTNAAWRLPPSHSRCRIGGAD